MIDDLVRLIDLGIITIDSIIDPAIKSEVQARLTAQ
jgi:hypothetical protein